MKVYTSFNIDYQSELKTFDALHPRRQIEIVEQKRNEDIDIFTFSPYLINAAETYGISIFEIETNKEIKVLEPVYKLMAQPLQDLENLRWSE